MESAMAVADAGRTGPDAEWFRPDIGRRGLLVAAILVVGLALGLRVANVATAESTPLFNHGIAMFDAQYYDKVAREIAGGDWRGSEVFYLGPLYPYTLGTIYVLSGGADASGDWTTAQRTARYVQAVQGALSALLVLLIAWRLAGGLAGLVAGALAAIYGPFVYYDLLLMPTSQILFLHLVAIYVLLVATSRWTRGPWLLAGLLLALCALAHGSAFFLVAALGPWVWLRRCRTLREKLAATLLMAATFAPVIATVTARNWIVGRDLVLVTSNAGKNLYIGNNPESDGTFGTYGFPLWGSSLYYYLYDIPRTPSDPPPSEVSRLLAARAWDFVRDDPGAAARIFARKAALFVNWFEIGTNDHYYTARQWLPVLGLPLPTFGLVAPVGIAALLIGAARRWPAGLLFAVVGSQAACFVLVFVLARYRVVTVACLMVATGLLAAWLTARVSRREWRWLAAYGAAVLLSGAAVHRDIPGFDPSRGMGQQHVFVAEGQIAEGRLAEAERELDAALGADFSPWPNPDLWHAHIHSLLGEMALAREDAGLAREWFERGLALLEGNSSNPRTLEIAPRLRRGLERALAAEQPETQADATEDEPE